jgi:hypothetical protein
MPDGAGQRPQEDAMRRIAATGDPLAEFYRQMVGKAVRLHLRLTDVISLRAYAAALRVLASTLERLSYSKEADHVILMQARNAIEAANRAIGGSRHKPRPDVD